MKKLLFTLLILFGAGFAYASNVFIESFEYANHDMEAPTGWVSANDSWLCGYLEKDHQRIAHTGNWYAYTDSTESWMFMPMFMSSQLKYRFSLWAITDGGFQLEIWAGNDANPNAMTQLLLDDIVTCATYDKFETYIDEVTADYQYFGIHAVQSYCGDCILTIDDISVDMIDKYAFSAIPFETSTVMQPGTQTVFNCKIFNEGYEDLTIYMTPYSDYFTDVHFFIDGQMTNSFPIEHNEIVSVIGEATLRPDVEPGSLCWVDVMFTIDCGCATAMFTLWATVATDNVEENYSEMSFYPNPSNGPVTIEGDGIVTIFNCLGQTVLTKEIIDKETITLEKGLYFIKKDNHPTEKLIIR